MDTRAQFGTVIIKRIPSFQAAGFEGRHGRRTAGVEHVDASRSHLNEFGSDIPGVDPTDVAACIRAATAHAGAAFRRGASVAFSSMCVASPAYFRPGNPAAVGTWDEGRLRPWLDLNLRVHRERFGPIACWRLDLDESTPHVIIIHVPVSARRTRAGKSKHVVSVRDAIGGHAARMCAIQDWYGRAMGPLGLARGAPKTMTGAVRRTVREMHTALETDRAAAARDAEYAARLRAEAEGIVAAAREAAAHERSAAQARAARLALAVRAGTSAMRQDLTRRDAELRGREAALSALDGIATLVRSRLPDWQRTIDRIEGPDRGDRRRAVSELAAEVAATHRRMRIARQG